MTYRSAGVDIEGADQWLARMRPVIRSTHRPGVLPDRGQFAGLFHLAASGARDPVLVASTDGVGTKLKLAQWAGAHQGIGVDVVAMNTNDVLAYGAEPLLFLDYIALGRLDRDLMTQLLRGVAQGCRLSGCALLGGETAEMPEVYQPGEYDVAGFCVGVVERRRVLDGSRVRRGDVLVGLASSGVHANGFSLVRKALTRAQMMRWKRELLVPTRIYVKPVLAALRRVPLAAIAHVTGGGLARRLPGLVSRAPGLQACLSSPRWPAPRIFKLIQAAGGLTAEEMLGTFNMGIGMVLVCRPQESGRLIRFLARLRVAAWPIGTIERN